MVHKKRGLKSQKSKPSTLSASYLYSFFLILRQILDSSCLQELGTLFLSVELLSALSVSETVVWLLTLQTFL